MMLILLILFYNGSSVAWTVVSLAKLSQSYITNDGQSASLSWCQPPSGVQDNVFVTVRQLRVCWCGTPSLTSGRVCSLELLLVIASAVIIGSYSLGTHDHTLLSQIRDSTNLEDQDPIFIYPRNRVVQLFLLALTSLFIASYDSQAYTEVFEPASTQG
jgi:hypothetical protein